MIIRFSPVRFPLQRLIFFKNRFLFLLQPTSHDAIFVEIR